MTQEEINQAEWSNPQNWSGPKWCKLYFSRRDTRAWVPKWHKAFGWTINIGNPRGAVWLAGVTIWAIAFVVFSNAIALNLLQRK
jgi:uncharacterized membrane protein